MRKIKTHEELLKLDGEKVTCYIEDEFIDDARIRVENDHVYICQNVKNGVDGIDKLGYKHSWFISEEEGLYEEYAYECKDILLVEDANEYTYGDTSHWPEWFDGRPILCESYEGAERREFFCCAVVQFSNKGVVFFIDAHGRSCIDAKPIVKKKTFRVKSASDIMKYLENHEKYEVDTEGNWRYFVLSSSPIQTRRDFETFRWQYCGKELKVDFIDPWGRYISNNLIWLPEWVEEVWG